MPDESIQELRRTAELSGTREDRQAYHAALKRAGTLDYPDLVRDLDDHGVLRDLTGSGFRGRILRPWEDHGERVPYPLKPEALAQIQVIALDGDGGIVCRWSGGASDGVPVVFLGSEGEAAVIAQDATEFFLLLGYDCSFYDLSAPQVPLLDPIPELLSRLEQVLGRDLGGDPRGAVERARASNTDFSSWLESSWAIALG